LATDVPRSAKLVFRACWLMPVSLAKKLVVPRGYGHYEVNPEPAISQDLAHV